MICALFGHSDTPESIYEPLKQTLTELIQNGTADTFYVGNHGNFDYMARCCLKALQKQYPQMRYYVVLAYMPGKTDPVPGHPTLLPDEQELALKKYAIEKRNRWIMREADMLVCYVKYTWGGAVKMLRSAKYNKKPIINLAAIQK